MNKVTLNFNEAMRLSECLDQCSKAPRAESESREDHLKFKYIVGKNWKNLQRLFVIAEEKQNDYINNSDEYKQYKAALDEIKDKYGLKDENGELVYDDDGQLQFPDKKEMKAYNAQVKPLNSKYQFIKDECERLATIEIELHTCPFSIVPERASGGYIEGIEAMLTDVPSLS